MEFMFPVDMGLVCIDKVKVFNINEGPASKKEFETYNKFPTIGDDGSISVKSDPYTVNYGELFTNADGVEKRNF